MLDAREWKRYRTHVSAEMSPYEVRLKKLGSLSRSHPGKQNLRAAILGCAVLAMLFLVFFGMYLYGGAAPRHVEPVQSAAVQLFSVNAAADYLFIAGAPFALALLITQMLILNSIRGGINRQ